MYSASYFSKIFLLILLFPISCVSTSGSIDKTEEGDTHSAESEYSVDFYPAYGYKQEDTWVIPATAYVYEYRGYLENLVISLSQVLHQFEPEESEIFRTRLRAFTADSESRETVTFVFDNDVEREEYTILDRQGEPVRSNLNGMIIGEIRISGKKAEILLDRQDSGDGWLTFTAIPGRHSGSGRVKLTDRYGLSVISDIDDTIKISELPAGANIAASNAFLKKYSATDGMIELLQQWEEASFHYVSGTPKQFYRPLSEFMFSEDVGLPHGTFHFRNVRKNLFSLNTWRDLEDIIMNNQVTFNQKLSNIKTIIDHFPEREFILVGDSGQHDPEIYRMIDEIYPKRIREIIIHDVVNDREHNPDRLRGMKIIPPFAEQDMSGV